MDPQLVSSRRRAAWLFLLLAGATILAVCLVNISHIYPRFVANLVADAEAESVRTARYITYLYHPPGEPLEQGVLTERLSEHAEGMKEHLGLWKLKVFSSSGEVIYSSDPGDLGVVNTHPYFVDRVTRGEVVTKTVVKETRTLEGQITPRDVVETYVPVMDGATFLGSFEIYYDITDRKAVVEAAVLRATVLTLGVALALLVALVVATWRARRAEIRREHAEARHLEVEQKLLQADKMRALGQLAGGIAHDFNNQLTSITGYAELLRERLGGDDARTAKGLDAVLRAARRSADLVMQLLAFARKGQFRASRVDVHGLISEVVSMLRHSVCKKIRIEEHLNASLAVTTGDATQLQNALLNIALNSRDAIHREGRIEISTEVVRLTDEALQARGLGLSAGPYVVVSVVDDGVGMDEAVRARVFEPFFTTREEEGGTGMGLAAAYGTISNHGGTIDVRSRPGEGTVVEVYLPLAPAHVRPPETGPLDAPRAGAGRVLVVDDEESVCEVTNELLASLGYTVRAFTNARQAVAHYREHWATTDVVLMDMVMPGLDGREVFAELRSINPGVLAVVFSGFSLNAAVQSVLEDGAAGFLQKPFACDDLARVLDETLTSPRPLAAADS